MINASKEFKQKLKDGANIVNYADVTLADGTVLHLTYKDFMVGGCSIDDKTTDGKFGVGFCIGKTLTMRIANHDERFSRYDFYGSIIHLYVALLLDNGTVEKLRKGIYYAMVPSTPVDIIEISAVDGMYRLDRDYSASRTIYPATLQTILTDACLDCGIPIGFRQFDNMGFIVQARPEKATYRQVVSWACQIAGYNARIDNAGYMQLIWYNTSLLDWYHYDGGSFRVYPHDTVVDGGNFTDYSTGTIISDWTFADEMPEHIFRIKSLDVHTDDVQITGVRVLGDDISELFGEEGYVIEVSDNPFSMGKERVVADYLGGRIVGIIFRPFSAQVLGNPLYEPFDIVRVSDRKGNVYDSLLNSISYTVGSYTQIACEAEDPIRNGSMYFSQAAAASAAARRNTERQLSNYDKAVQNMTQLAGNALGYHTTYEKQDDGSTITYLHDKPTLAASRIIYKQTIDGFFISTDGGQSYTAGFDAQGNAIVNILYAIGIVADWIRGGTLTLGGDNNINGSLKILDAVGTQIGKWDKDGISATKGTFSGSLNAATGTFKGALSAATGSFTGTVNATTLNSANANITGGSINISSSSQSYSSITVKYGNYQSSISPTFLTSKTGENYVQIGSIGSILVKSEGKQTSISGSSVAVQGALTVSGYKSRTCQTKNYLNRLLYCYETSKPYFGDIGEATLDEDGVCYIFLDDIFAETVNTDCQYQVFLQKYGPGDVWVEERTKNYFIVRGTAGIRFGWEIKARQLGFEIERLEKFSQEDPEQTIDYEAEAQNYINNFYKEVFNYEGSN